MLSVGVRKGRADIYVKAYCSALQVAPGSL